MDTSKRGDLGVSEFKTCLLALGIRASSENVATLFATGFGGDFSRPLGKVSYVGLVKAFVADLPPLPPSEPQQPRHFVSALVNPAAAAAHQPPTTLPPAPPPPPGSAVRTAAFFPYSKTGMIGMAPLSDEVGEFEGRVEELEHTVHELCKELQATNQALAETEVEKERAEKKGQASAQAYGLEVEEKNSDLASLQTDISELTTSLVTLSAREGELSTQVALKEEVAKKNRQRRKDKDAMILQLTKATQENEDQLSELQAVADELLSELASTEASTLRANLHVGELLTPSKPPQSVTLRTTTTAEAFPAPGSPGSVASSTPRSLGDKKRTKEAIRMRNQRAEEQHRINLLRAQHK